jgi:regulator of protease activity HflC (stomatin/prohibitin superfamily)
MFQIPSDLLVRFQPIDMVDIIFWQIMRLSVVYTQKIKDWTALNRRAPSVSHSIRWNLENWGIKVTTVEVKHVDLPQEMQRAMARQAEAERERWAKVINAEGEFQAAARLAEAAEIIAVHPQPLQLRFLQTLTEVATENNSTILFPIPIDLLTPFLHRNQPAVGSGGNGELQG